MSKVLIIEPHDNVRKGLVQRFHQAGIEIISAADFYQAEALIQEFLPGVVILDINEEDPEALNPLKKLRKEHPDIAVITTSAFGSVETAVMAILIGAAEFMLKPYPTMKLVEKTLKYLESQGKKTQGTARDRRRDPSTRIIGKSPAIRNIIKLVEGNANTDKTVLISGENGVGKTLIASLIHQTSRRAGNPLLSINCSAFSDEHFLNCELFGFAKGAFEGANVPREGVLIKADRGTLLLDEIGYLPLGTQARLLGYLESGEIRRVGENIPLNPDTRIIATTRENLKARVGDGRFRSDLYFLLKNIFLEIPPLRSRGEDIPLLIKHFLKRLHRRGGPHYRLEKEALTSLCSLSYPGNVLELRNTLEQIISVSDRENIDMKVLERANISREPEEKGALQRMKSMEKEIIEKVIKKHPRDLCAAARELGVSRTTLWRRMKKHNMIAKEKDSGRSAGY